MAGEPYQYKKKPAPSSSSGYKYKTKGSSKRVESDWDLTQYVPDIIRGAAGFAPGGYIGAGVGAGAETLARFIEGKEFSLPAAGASAAFGAIPFHGVPGAVRAGLRGLGLSAGQTAAMQQADKGLHIPTPQEAQDIAVSGVVGGTAGVAAERILPKVLPKVFGKADTPTVKIDEPAIPAVKAEAPAAAPVVEPITPAVKPGQGTRTLPTDLAAKSPKFAVSGKSFTPQFSNDIDKALYIISQKTPNKRDADYMSFLRNATGLDDAQLRAAGGEIRGKLREKLSKSKVQGEVEVSKLHTIKLPRQARAKTPVIEEGINPVTGRPFKSAAAGGTPPPPPNVPPSAGIPPEPPTPPVNISEQVPTVKSPAENAQTAWEYAKQAPSELRQLMTWGDLSFPFRQGITNVHRPKEFWANFKPMIKSLIKEGNYERVEAEISAMPRHDKMMASNLDIHDPTKGIAGREENLRGVIIENIGGEKFRKWNPVRRTNQAYSAFAHKLRADLFNSIADNAEKAGIVLDDDAYRAIANFVNDTTGRGKLGKMEKHAPLLNEFLFAPKLIASRVNMFRRLLPGKGVLGTKWDDKAGKFVPLDLDPRLTSQLRYEAVKSMAAVGSLASVAGGVSALALKEPTAADYTSPDFGKFKTGKTRIDMSGGFQPYVRTAVMVAKELTDTKGKTRQTAGDVAGRFARNKLAPAASWIADWWYEQTPTGEKYETKDAFMSRVTPLIVQDLTRLAKEDPGMLPLAGGLSAFGMSTGTYGKDKPKRGALFNPRVTLP